MPGRPVRRATGPGHGAGFLRRRGARADARSRQTSRLRKHHPARRAASRVLRLGGAPCRLAPARRRRRPGSGGRYRRRHHRLHPHRGHRKRRRTGAHPRRRGRAHPARRRQHRPGPGQRGRRTAGAERHQNRQPPDAGALEQLPHGQGEAARTGFQGQGTGGHHSGHGHRPGGRHHQSHALARGYRPRARARASCRPCPAPRCPRASGAPACRKSDCRTPPIPAITRHLARFLRQQAATSEQGAVRRGPSGLACPTHVLFNGGVLNAAAGSPAHHRRAGFLAGGRGHGPGASRWPAKT